MASKRKGLASARPSDLIQQTTAAIGSADSGSGKPTARNLRLDEDTAEALRLLAFQQRRSAHSIMLEGLALAFEKHGVEMTPYLRDALAEDDTQGDLLKA